VGLSVGREDTRACIYAYVLFSTPPVYCGQADICREEVVGWRAAGSADYTSDWCFPLYARAQIEDDLLHPNPANEKRKHKLKRLVQAPNSFFMDVKCPGCFNITTVFSHAQSVVLCGNCNTVLCQPTGGKARLTEGCSFRRKVE
jgi:small subunit ribosomal protein S27e